MKRTVNKKTVIYIGMWLLILLDLKVNILELILNSINNYNHNLVALKVILF